MTPTFPALQGNPTGPTPPTFADIHSAARAALIAGADPKAVVDAVGRLALGALAIATTMNSSLEWYLLYQLLDIYRLGLELGTRHCLEAP